MDVWYLQMFIFNRNASQLEPRGDYIIMYNCCKRIPNRNNSFLFDRLEVKTENANLPID